MTQHDVLMELLDKATGFVAEIGIIRDELKKDGRLTEAAKTDLNKQWAIRKEVALKKYCDFVAALADTRWENLDLPCHRCKRAKSQKNKACS